MIEIHKKNIYSERFGRPNIPEKNIFIRLMKVSQVCHEPKINHVARNMLISPNENFLLKTNAWFSPRFALDHEEGGAGGGGWAMIPLKSPGSDRSSERKIKFRFFDFNVISLTRDSISSDALAIGAIK